MSRGLIFDNVVAYSLQIGMLVGVAAFIPAVLRLRQPGAKLVYWQILLAACLLLPLQPWKQVVAAGTSGGHNGNHGRARGTPFVVVAFDTAQRNRAPGAAGGSGDPAGMAGGGLLEVARLPPPLAAAGAGSRVERGGVAAGIG